MTAVDTVTGEVVETIGEAEARRLTTEAQNEFRSSADHFGKGWAAIEEAVKGGGHLDLGYRSPATTSIRSSTVCCRAWTWLRAEWPCGQ